ncbi:MAG TPA: hypothetical protein VEU77_08430 [Candidatus Acidoferrales bacterium]|nr:hypothetical protein [Candidatus Acidoferrales bacterium]
MLTRSAIATEADEAEACDDDALDVHVPADALVVPLDVAAGVALAADDAAGELVEVAALDVAAADAVAETAAELVASADADGAALEVAIADADGLTADDPNAAGEPLAPGVVPVGPHAIKRKRAALAVVTMSDLMTAMRRK